MRFFEPAPAFLAWAQANLKGSHVFDVGAGEGHVTDALAGRGLRVTALDLYPPEVLVGHAMYADGTLFPYPPDTTVMLCRPCHGGFPEVVVRRAKACGVAQILYVGLPRNVVGDLGPLRRKFRVVLTNAGKAGEKVWRWQLRDTTKNPVALVQLESWSAPYWMIDRGRYWENVSGGRSPKSDTDKVFERSEIEDFDFPALDWTKTGYNKPKGECGWLSPAGVFYGCDYHEHDMLAYLVIKKPVSELEEEGWVRVDRLDGHYPITFRCRTDPTEAQAKWLSARGHKLDPFGIKEEVGTLTVPERDRLAADAAVSSARRTPSNRRKLPREGD